MISFHLAKGIRFDARPPLWLSEDERRRLGLFKVSQRRSDWLLGRLAAKRLVRHLIEERYRLVLPPSAIEIGRLSSGAPLVRIAPEATGFLGLAPGDALPFWVSISHSNGRALAAAAFREDSGDGLGADIEFVAPRSRDLLEYFFAPEEQRLVSFSGNTDLTANVLWSAKEAVLKALGLGLKVDTRDVVCRPREVTRGWTVTNDWTRFEADLRGELAGRHVRIIGAWRRASELVVTLAVIESRSECRLYSGVRGLHVRAA